MIADYLTLAVRNVRRRGLRSWLTMLGIFIGIAAVVSLISLGQGLQDSINQQFEILGSDKIIIESKHIGPPGSSASELLILTSKDLKVISETRGVEKAAGILIKTGVAEFKDELKVSFAFGTDEEYLSLFEDLGNFAVIEGRNLEDEDKFKVVVGYNHAFGDRWSKPVELRNTITVEGIEFKVVGIRGKTGNPFDDNSLSIPKETMRELLNIGDEESQIIARTESGFNPENVAEEIERKLRKSRDEREDQETFNVTTAEQILQGFNRIFGIVQAVLVGIAAISLVVGGIGIMNTMYTAVLERTREIGIMKAIGAKNSDITLIFLFESGLLGLLGGIIGVTLGFGIGKATEYFAALSLGTDLLQASFPPQLILGALAFSFLVGSLSGLLPALQAAKLKPTEALRYQ